MYETLTTFRKLKRLQVSACAKSNRAVVITTVSASLPRCLHHDLCLLVLRCRVHVMLAKIVGAERE